MAPQAENWYMNILRPIFGFLDGLVYRLVRWILYGVFDISNISANSDVFSGIAQRIYVVLGIFMAFKLSFSFFQYIIDPDSMTKSEKGVPKLIMRVFLMLFALILLPSLLFGNGSSKGMLTRAQDAFLPVLPKLILGTESSNNVDTTVEESANEITLTTLKGFFTPPKEIDEKCGEGTYDSTPEIKSLEDFENNINLTCTVKGTGVLGIGATKYYKYSYMPFVSTIVGLLIAGLFLAITLDLAKRLFKLVILEVIAPIPIMSLIDPKGSKDGAFSHWLKNLVSTFLDIFLKLGIVYIVIVLIHMIVNANESGGLFVNYPSFQENGFRAVYLTIFLILGLIFFAKEAPKFIKESLGLKADGGGLFDDLKDIGRAAGVVGAGALGVASSGVAAFRSSWMADTANGHTGVGWRAVNLAKNLGSGLFGGIAGGFSGASSAFGAKNHYFGTGMDAIRKRNELSLSRGAAGSTLFGRVRTGISRTVTGETAVDRMDRRIARLEGLGSSGEALHSYLEDRAVKKGYGYSVSAKRDSGASFSTTYDAFTRAWAQAKQNGVRDFTVGGQSFETYGAEAARIEGDLKTAAADKWLENQLRLRPNDAGYDETFHDLSTAYVDSGGTMVDSAHAGGFTSGLKTQFKTNSRHAKNMKSSTRYGRYKANANATKR